MDTELSSELKFELQRSLNLPESEQKRYARKLRKQALKLLKNAPNKSEYYFFHSIRTSCEEEMQWKPEGYLPQDFAEGGSVNMKCGYLSERRLNYYRQFKDLVECPFNSLTELDAIPIDDLPGKLILRYLVFDGTATSIIHTMEEITDQQNTSVSLALSPPYSEINEETIAQLKNMFAWQMFCDDVPPKQKLDLLKHHFSNLHIFWIFGGDENHNAIGIINYAVNVSGAFGKSPGGLYDITNRLTPDAHIICSHCSTSVDFNHTGVGIGTKTNTVYCPECRQSLLEVIAENAPIVS